jgi:hypothetical protein
VLFRSRQPGSAHPRHHGLEWVGYYLSAAGALSLAAALAIHWRSPEPVQSAV